MELFSDYEDEHTDGTLHILVSLGNLEATKKESMHVCSDQKKARQVMRGCVLNADDMDTYSFVMKTMAAWLLFIISDSNRNQDIKNSSTYARYVTTLCVCIRPEFV